MPFRWLTCLLLASIAFGQAAPPASSASGGAKIEQAAPAIPVHAELNDAHFGPARNPAMPAPPQGDKPADQPVADPD